MISWIFCQFTKLSCIRITELTRFTKLVVYKNLLIYMFTEVKVVGMVVIGKLGEPLRLIWTRLDGGTTIQGVIKTHFLWLSATFEASVKSSYSVCNGIPSQSQMSSHSLNNFCTTQTYEQLSTSNSHVMKLREAWLKCMTAHEVMHWIRTNSSTPDQLSSLAASENLLKLIAIIESFPVIFSFYSHSWISCDWGSHSPCYGVTFPSRGWSYAPLLSQVWLEQQILWVVMLMHKACVQERGFFSSGDLLKEVVWVMSPVYSLVSGIQEWIQSVCRRLVVEMERIVD